MTSKTLVACCASALMLGPLTAVQAELEFAEDDCEGFEQPRAGDVRCAPAERGTSDPHCGYHGDMAKDVKAAFKKLKKAAGLTGIKLAYFPKPWTREGDCEGGGAAAIPRSGRAPALVVICGSLFASTRNIDQLAVVIGHELGHLALKHSERTEVAEREAIDLWKRTKTPEYLRDTPEKDQKEDLKRERCPLMNTASRRLEDEADDYGLKLAARAGFDPQEAPKVFWQDRDLLWARREKDWHGDHSADGKRAERLERLAIKVLQGLPE